MIRLRLIPGPTPDYNRDMAASVELVAAAKLIALALRGCEDYTRADRFDRRLQVLHYLSNLVDGLDDAGLRSVRTAMIGILRADEVSELVASAVERARPKTTEEVFRGL